MNNQVKEMEYETPRVKMIVVEVEQGFAVSNPTGTLPGEESIG